MKMVQLMVENCHTVHESRPQELNWRSVSHGFSPWDGGGVFMASPIFNKDQMNIDHDGCCNLVLMIVNDGQ